LYLAKKYLWNNYRPKKARENLRNAMKKIPYKIYPLILYLLTLVPEKTLIRMYDFGKSPKNHS